MVDYCYANHAFCSSRKDIKSILETFPHFQIFTNNGVNNLLQGVVIPLLLFCGKTNKTQIAKIPAIISSPATIALGLSLHGVSDVVSLRQRDLSLSRELISQSRMMSRGMTLMILPHRKVKEVRDEDVENTCLKISPKVFTSTQGIPSYGKADKTLTSSESIIFDNYKQENNDFTRIRKLKNRHVMIVKAFVEHLNLSLDACGASQYPGGSFPTSPHRHLDFGISSYSQQMEKAPHFALVFSREQFSVAFASTVWPDHAAMLLSLIRPVGWKVFVATLASAVAITLFITLYFHLEALLMRNACRNEDTVEKVSSRIPDHRHHSLGHIAKLIFRPPIDQCVSHPTLTSTLSASPVVQLIYTGWLIYSLLFTATYRSNLVGTWIQPSPPLALETFQELADDGRRLLGVGQGGRPGQYSSVELFLKAESERNPVFQTLLSKYEKHLDVRPQEVLGGTVNFLDDAFLVKSLCLLLVISYNVLHYKVGSTLANPEYWAVKYGPHSHGMLNVLGRLMQAGISDQYKKEQDLMEMMVSRRILKIYFDSVILQGSAGSEDYDDEEKEDDSKKEEQNEKRRQSKFKTMRLKQFGLEVINNGPISLKMWNLAMPFILLVVGLSLSIFTFVGQQLYKNLTSM